MTIPARASRRPAPSRRRPTEADASPSAGHPGRLALALLGPLLAACGPGALPGPHATLEPAYRVQGMDQDGAGYVGKVELTPTDDGYRITAVRGGDTLRGSLDPAGLVAGDSFDLEMADPWNATGRYVRYPDGRLEGRWRTADGADGWEVLRPYDTALPRPDVRESYDSARGTIRIGPGPADLFPRTDEGYTLIRPTGVPTRAVAVFFDGFRVRDVAGPPVKGSFDAEALGAGVALLRVTTGDPLDFLFTDAEVDAVLDRIGRALQAHDLEGAPLLFTGLSLGGTRAAKAAVRLGRSPDRDPALHLVALAVVDAPLDMARLYRGEIKAIRDDAHPAAAGEGRWVTYRLREALGGSPDQVPDAYVRYSPVSAGEPAGGNVDALVSVAVRAYHEPDIDWWIEHRSKTYGQINSPDLALLVERLRALGGGAELITSHRQRDGWAFGASPHTWSFVDNADLVAWFLDRT